MLQEALDFKEKFFKELESLKIPTYNRAICFYYLSLKFEENPDNETIRQLLITAICDHEFLLYHFLPQQSSEELIENYRITRLKSNKLNKLLAENRLLMEQWAQISKRKTLPAIKNLSPTKYNTIQNETSMLCQLYYQYFDISEKKTPELRNNLEHFVELSYSYHDYHLIAPFFFYQIMIKHTKRLSTNTNFQFVPKSLWEYKEYTTTHNNKKNYETYQKNILLFLDLCKYYELCFDVNIDLCKYAFTQTCNLMEWIEFYDEEIAESCRTPLSQFYENLDFSYIEPYEAKEYDFCSTYNISFKTDLYYNDIYGEEYIEIENTIVHFLLEHPEYLIQFMTELHHDIKSIKDIVLTIYNNTNLDILYPHEIPIEYRLSNVYFVLSECVDKTVKLKVQNCL